MSFGDVTRLFGDSHYLYDEPEPDDDDYEDEDDDDDYYEEPSESCVHCGKTYYERGPFNDGPFIGDDWKDNAHISCEYHHLIEKAAEGK